MNDYEFTGQPLYWDKDKVRIILYTLLWGYVFGIFIAHQFVLRDLQLEEELKLHPPIQELPLEEWIPRIEEIRRANAHKNMITDREPYGYAWNPDKYKHPEKYKQDAPLEYQLDFQDPSTPIMEGIIDLHNDIFFYLVLILAAVTWILIRTIWLFRKSANRKLRHFTHNTFLEIVWTITPALILMIIATPSFALLYSMDEIIDPDMTIKAIGHQWYWSYEYADYMNIHKDESAEKDLDLVSFAFDSYMIPEEDLTNGQLRLLEVDNRIVVPVNTHVRMLVTSTDVIHSWTVPSLGVKVDAVPGRLNQLSFFIQRTGVFYGQCSEICGVNHGFMPIVVEAVSLDDYIDWVYSKLYS